MKIESATKELTEKIDPATLELSETKKEVGTLAQILKQNVFPILNSMPEFTLKPEKQCGDILESICSRNGI